MTGKLTLFFLTGFGITSLHGTGLAETDARAHELCKDARDYLGCVKSQSSNTRKNEKATAVKPSKEIKDCHNSAEEAISSKPGFAKYAEKRNKIPEICATLVEYEASAKAKSTNKTIKSEVGSCIIHGIFNDWPAAGARDTCICVGDFTSTNREYSGGQALKYCLTKARNSIVAGFRLLSDKEGLRFGYREETITQAKIRGGYGRYISFTGRSESTYSGSSGFIIPGKEGFIDCRYSGSGNILGWSAGGGCYGESGTQPIYVPGEAGGVQSGIFSYLLDCRDKTFDRKGDLQSASGGRKGWMDISEDPVAAYVADAYCPIIKTLPTSEQ